MFCGYCGKENSKDYSFCTKCGKLLESEIESQTINLAHKPKISSDSSQEVKDTESHEEKTPDQPIQTKYKYEIPTKTPQEHQNIENPEETEPHSKYKSVTWWKNCEWPWQARSLDGETLIGNFEKQEDAADAIAKFHDLSSRVDLLIYRPRATSKNETMSLKIKAQPNAIVDLKQESTGTKNREGEVCQSNYISVYWWKDGHWPWQARSLDDHTLLGSYQTEIEAAKVVAKRHGINVADLLISRQITELEREEKRKLLCKAVLERTNKQPEKNKVSKASSEDDLSLDLPQVSSLPEKNKAPKVASEDYLSFDSPQIAGLSGYTNTPMPISGKQDLPQENIPTAKPSVKELIREAVRGKDYYVDQFIPFYETGKGIRSWNWAAFLVGPIWFLYRKVYSLFFIQLFFCSVDFWAEQTNVSELFQLITSLSLLAAWIYCAVKSNKTYYDNVLRKIEGRENRLKGMLKIPAIILFVSAFWSWVSYDGYLSTVEILLPMLNLKGVLGQAGNWLIVCIQGALGYFFWELSKEK
jgi:hypothetical protein